MGVVSWLVLGLVVGVLAKMLMPGKDPGGMFVTIAIGIAGAFIGGGIGTSLGIGNVDGFDLTSLALATIGALLLLAAYRLLKRD